MCRYQWSQDSSVSGRVGYIVEVATAPVTFLSAFSFMNFLTHIPHL